MSTQPPDPQLRQYVQVLRRQAWLVALMPAMTIAATLAILSFQEPVYRASMTLVVGESRGPLEAPALGSGSVTRTMTNLLESDFVARSVIARARLDVSKEQFLKDLDVKVLPDTSVLDVTYKTSDRGTGLAVMRELARIFTRQIDETLGVRGTGTDTRRRAGSFDLIVRVFDPPNVGAEPLPPKRAQKVVFAGVAGLILSLLLGLMRDSLDSRIRGRSDAEQSVRAPVIGALPRGLSKGVALGLDGRLARADESESLHILRANLELSRARTAGGSRVLVTSALTDEGKSPVAANLAATLALTGKDVICVDANLRRPILHLHLGVEGEGEGFADVLEGRASLDDVLIDVFPAGSVNGTGTTEGKPSRGQGRLRLLRSGNATERLGVLLSGDEISNLLDGLSVLADYVVVDAPPLLTSADAFPLVMAADTDTLLVVIRQGRTTRERARAVRTTLDGLGAQRVAVVLTDSRAGVGAASG